MWFRKTLLCFLFIVTINSGFSQFKSIQELELELVDSWNVYLDSAFEFTKYTDSTCQAFNNNLIATLQKPESFDYDFDSLKLCIGIMWTHDKKVKVYSWHRSLGGCWHDLVAYAQYKTPNGVALLKLHTDQESMTGEYTDASYFKSSYVPSKNGMIYLFEGWGTHGAGHHHYILRGFKFENDVLVETDSLFAGQKRLAVEGTRSMKDNIKLEFDQKTKTISYNVYKFNEYSGFMEYQECQNTVYWDGTQFVDNDGHMKSILK